MSNEQPRAELVESAVDHPQHDHRRDGGDPAHDAREEVREDTMDDDEKAESGLLTEE